MSPTSVSLRDRIRALFTARDSSLPPTAMGAELGLIPVYADTQERPPIESLSGKVGTAEILRTAAKYARWVEVNGPRGGPAWYTRAGGKICFNPGGQIKISSPVCEHATALIDFMQHTAHVVRDVGAVYGITFLSLGMDPYNDVRTMPLRLLSDRYLRMTRYFDTKGAASATASVRLMRQSASLHLNVQLGPNPFIRWRLLNALAPYLVAMYANSCTYMRTGSGYASYRAHLWRMLDPSRTGLPYDVLDPVGAYTRFAENAGRILTDDGAHLTTLYPEVRPHGYFEVRGIDSVDSDRLTDAISFVSALVYDEKASAAALELLGEPDPGLLMTASRLGMQDPAMMSTVRTVRTLRQIAGEVEGVGVVGAAVG